MADWIKIYTTRNYAEASIIKGMLEENNIEAVVMNKMDSSYLNFGDIEIHVPADAATTARALIAEGLHLQ